MTQFIDIIKAVVTKATLGSYGLGILKPLVFWSAPWAILELLPFYEQKPN